MPLEKNLFYGHLFVLIRSSGFDRQNIVFATKTLYVVVIIVLGFHTIVVKHNRLTVTCRNGLYHGWW